MDNAWSWISECQTKLRLSHTCVLLWLSLMVVASSSFAACLPVNDGKLDPAITSAAEAEIAENPELYENGEAISWQVRKDGIDRGVIWGTLHFPSIYTSYVPTRVLMALDRSDDYLGEVDFQRVPFSELTVLIAKSSRVRADTNRHSPVDAMDTEAAGALSKTLNELGYSDAQYKSLTLFGVEAILSFGSMCYENSLYDQPASVPDFMLEQRAALLRKSISGIESLSYQIDRLANVDDETMASVDKFLLKRSPHKAEMMNYYFVAYFRGRPDLATAANVGWLAEPGERDAMARRSFGAVVDRNEAFAMAIEHQMEQPGFHFAAVGALHLMGRSGVVSILRQHGLEIAPFAASGE